MDAIGNRSDFKHSTDMKPNRGKRLFDWNADKFGISERLICRKYLSHKLAGKIFAIDMGIATMFMPKMPGASLGFATSDPATLNRLRSVVSTKDIFVGRSSMGNEIY